MAIETVETWILRFGSNRLAAERSDEFFELIGVTVHDKSGEHGTGWTFTSDYGGGGAVKALLDALLVERLVGREAVDIEVIYRELRHVTHRLGDGIASMAIAAIDIALWDLRARMSGQSLAQALGQVRDRVPAYGSGKASPTLSIDELVASSVGYVSQGFNAVKIRVGREIGRDMDRVAAVRDAVGPGIRILCDANERLDIAGALWLGRKLADLDVFWFEEPILSGNLAGYHRLRQALPMPVAFGEHVHASREFTAAVQMGAVDILQPDVCMIGGVTEFMQVARLADSNGLAIAPHFMSPLHVHLVAALPEALYLEFYPFMDDLIREPLLMDDGGVLVPDRIGHGVEFTDASWKKYRIA
jgi:L-alanine-DL-glutamate epimerase-like enolase superfamily enzyme